MSLFDRLHLDGIPCPTCGTTQDWVVQLKHGDCRQRELRIGDEVTFVVGDYRSAYGYPNDGRFATVGAVENSCGHCSALLDAEVIVDNNVVAAARLGEEYSFSSDDDANGIRWIRAPRELSSVEGRFTESGRRQCLNCGWKPAGVLGREGRCPKCARWVVVPDGG